MAGESKIVITGDSKDAVAALEKLIGKIDEFGKEGKKAAGETSQSFEVFKGVIAAEALKAGLNAIISGFQALTGFVKSSIGESAAAEAANQKLAFALQQTGQFSAGAVKGLQDFASQLQATTKFSDEQITTSAALIQSLAALDTQGLKRATAASADLATALGVDLETASRLVAKAANGQTEALGKLGVVVAETGDKSKDFEAVLGQIESRFGGAAAKAGETFEGSLARLKNSFSDLQESVGGLITSSPAITGLLGGIGDAFGLLQKVIEANKETILAFISGGVDFLVQSLGLIPVAINTILDLSQGFSTFFAFVSDQLDATVQSILEFSGNVTGAVASVQEFFGVNAEGARQLQDQFKLAAEQAQIERDQRASDLAQEQADTETRKAAVDDFFIKVQESINGRIALAEDANSRELAAEKGKYDNLSILSKDDLARRKKDADEAKKLADKKTADEKKANEQKERDLQSSLGSVKGLVSSNNKELFAIGKATSLATATIDGISAVQKALASAPPPFNFALAALVGAAQAVNLSKISSQQAPTGAFEGGLVTGGSLFKDTEPFMLSKGELVVPRQNFDEVVNATAASRGLTESTTNNNGVTVNVVLQGDNYGDDAFIDKVGKGIRDAIEFRGLQLQPVGG